VRSNYSAIGKFVVYIKSTKDKARGDALLGRALTGRSTIVDIFIETSVRKNYKPELDKAVKKCNARSAKLIIPNIGHLPRSLAFCNSVSKLDGNDPYICAIRETDGHVAVYKYHTMQMLLQCVDQIDVNKKVAKKGLDKKRATGWKPGNPVNLDVATINASKARQQLADDYCNEIMPVIREIQRFGKVTLQGIANALMARNIKTRRGKDVWTPMGVSNLLKKAGELGI
tara:strand:+ start:3048 stop:3731 length:684 start_codon:yes stop_codon:yes gene_type:complete